MASHGEGRMGWGRMGTNGDEWARIGDGDAWARSEWGRMGTHWAWQRMGTNGHELARIVTILAEIATTCDEMEQMGTNGHELIRFVANSAGTGQGRGPDGPDGPMGRNEWGGTGAIEWGRIGASRDEWDEWGAHGEWGGIGLTIDILTI